MEGSMPKVKQVLKHVSVETAQRRRKCYRKPTKHAIEAADICLVVVEAGIKRNYCPECAEPILATAEDDLNQLRGQLQL
jgi:hypothetical protein